MAALHREVLNVGSARVWHSQSIVLLDGLTHRRTARNAAVVGIVADFVTTV